MDLVREEERRAMNALRWLLLPSAALAGWIGLAYILGDPLRTATPSFDAMRSVAPMHVWGWLFLFGSVILVIAGIIGKLTYVAVALFTGGAIYAWWASMFLVSLFAYPAPSSISAPGLYYFVAFVHFSGAWRMYTRQPRA